MKIFLVVHKITREATQHTC